MNEIIFDEPMERAAGGEIRERLIWRHCDGDSGYELSCDFHQIRFKAMDGRSFRHVAAPPFNRIFLPFGAAITLQVAGESMEIPSGSGILLPAGMPFQAHYADRGNLWYAHFNCRNRIGEEVFRFCPAPLPLAGEALRRAGELVSSAFVPADCGILVSIIYSLVPPAALQRARELDRPDSLLLRFLQLLETVPPAQARIKELAEQLGVSSSTLGRACRQYLGMPVKEYLQTRLQERIQLALQDQHSDLSTIAARLGFSDDAYFHRVCKRRFGQTPAALRGGL